ncbi:MAG TPA: RNA polymerase factor sigma-54 [Ignavibacteria bacterium]|nr:RNA polymerase factor sigma-54 [Ignavibacteria bacterium]HRF66378.1 RNA polymerase factor sigma-54 [Ignavibacteria bacterium]HRJ05482.1 RNA polymerase factor sigma-54 [Ignavibacteria bacterium]
MLKNTQGQFQQQKLSPQAIQAQLLLAIPTIALEQEIKKQLEENPVLEDNIDTEDKTETSPGEIYDTGNWNSYNERSNYSSNFSGTDEERTDYLLNRQGKQKETPLEQVYSMGLDTDELIIAEEILGNLEDDGYLRISLEEIKEDITEKYSIEPGMEKIESVLRMVQNIDPPGIAARNLQECLSIQLNDSSNGLTDDDRRLCLSMINEYFEEFKLKHFEKLAKLLDVNLEKVNELFEIIHRLNPAPGKQDIAADYIIPDFIVKEVEGSLKVELTGSSKPGIKISKKYMEMLKDKSTEKDTKDFLKNKVESARWFINAIESRRNTMLKIMNAIVARQMEFFTSHGENIKPMFEKDIAEDISMDISTVSRVVRGKYVQTDFGIFDLKYFFSAAMKTESGEDVSNKIFMDKIRDLIEKEDKSKPLSDDKIAEMMNKEGFNLARRTVAKYRENMKIPKATLRRKIILN